MVRMARAPHLHIPPTTSLSAAYCRPGRRATPQGHAAGPDRGGGGAPRGGVQPAARPDREAGGRTGGLQLSLHCGKRHGVLSPMPSLRHTLRGWHQPTCPAASTAPPESWRRVSRIAHRERLRHPSWALPGVLPDPHQPCSSNHSTVPYRARMLGLSGIHIGQDRPAGGRRGAC